MCETVSGRIKVLSNKFISKVVAKSVCEFVCVGKFVSAPMFVQWVQLSVVMLMTFVGECQNNFKQQ